MPQYRITRFFQHEQAPSPATRRTTFLALPYCVRREIYLAASLWLYSDFIDLNRRCLPRRPCSTSAEQPFDPTEDGYEIFKSRHSRECPLALLLTCRAIHLEVTMLLYSRPWFGISRRGPGALANLETLSIPAIKSLRTIVVHLTPCRCIGDCVRESEHDEPHSTYSFYSTYLDRRGWEWEHSRPQGDQSRLDTRALRDWERVCNHLARHISAGQLRLYIICWVESESVARQILQPLSGLPALADLGLDLGPGTPHNRRTLQDLAFTQRQALTAQPIIHPPFRFLDLPRELQLEVLQHTNLTATHPILIDATGFTNLQGWPHPCYWVSSGVETLEELLLSVFCRRRGATDWIGCHHDPFYHRSFRLFTVSRAFSNLAVEISYSQSIFEIGTWFCLRHAAPQPSDDAQDHIIDLGRVHSFLGQLPPSSLGYIRRLRIWLPPLGVGSLADDRLDWRAWDEGFDGMSQSLLVSQLRIELCFSEYDRITRAELARRRAASSGAGSVSVLAAYKRAVRPLQALQGLRTLAIHVPFPSGADRAKERRELERELECMVMGPSYNAYADGKGAPSPRTERTPSVGHEYD